MKVNKLDAKGFICPLPVLKARKFLLSMQSGEYLNIEFTDKSAVKDFKLFCSETGHILEKMEEKRINENIVFKAIIVCK